MSIEHQFNLRFPIYWNDWPIEEEFAKYLINKIVTQRPKKIVEFGGGTSTLIMLKTLEKLGYEYNLISIDSDSYFINGTKNLLVAEDVYDEKKVKLVHAPIKDLEIDGNLYKWYDTEKFKFDFSKVDLVFVDGPIGGFCKNARYPALRIMKSYLKRGSIVILHDAKRADEIEIVEMWKKETPHIINDYKIETKMGGAEIQF